MAARLSLALAALLLAGCAPYMQDGYDGPPAGSPPEKFTCCHDPETFAAPIAIAGLEVAEYVVPLTHNDKPRPGKLTGKPEAHAAITSRMRPGDIVLMANKTAINGRFLPGHFTHSAVYMGNEAELRAMELWDDPAYRPYHGDIRANRVFVEALTPEVHLSTPAYLFEVDAVAILEPALTDAERRDALRAVLAEMGVPFDYRFDFSETETLACTELIELAMPSLPFTRRDVYGRPAVMPDDIIAQAIRGGEGFEVIAHVRGTDTGYEVLGSRSLMTDIGRWWGPQPTL